MSTITEPSIDPNIEAQARELYLQKQREFLDAMKGREGDNAAAAAQDLETFVKSSVGITCKILTVSEPFIWGQATAEIYYTSNGTKLSFYGTGWGIGLGAGAGGGGGLGTDDPNNLVGDTPFEIFFTTVQATMVCYKSDGVVISLFCPGAFPGAGYLKGTGTWKLGW
ncbi:hypothetical protein EP7_001375 [Isosphaeraceae bacterium EP7]